MSTVKVGLELFLRHGHDAVARSAARPAAAATCSSTSSCTTSPTPSPVPPGRSPSSRPTYLTVHASGGADDGRAPPSRRCPAHAGRRRHRAHVAVRASELAAVGLAGPPRDAVRRLAALAVEARRAGAGLLAARGRRRTSRGRRRTSRSSRPGSGRPAATRGDQARVATPEQALADGADLLVIGRPITGADRRRGAPPPRHRRASLRLTSADQLDICRRRLSFSHCLQGLAVARFAGVLVRCSDARGDLSWHFPR